ncbi:ATP synthase F0 subunit C [Candidatus Beckwithbacteria bacterium]|nr:ATP synthase F0 subunit C [Candidatus Beckwithbacteria bacterium]
MEEVAQVVNSLDALKPFAVGLTIAIGGSLPAFAIGKIVTSGLKAIGRNPDAADKIQTSMILGLAFAEAIAIYALVVALIIKFV